MTRFVLIVCLAATASTFGCGALSKQIAGPHVEPNDDVGDVVTGSMSAPESPGLNGPSTPGGAGAGGGTPRPKR